MALYLVDVGKYMMSLSLCFYFCTRGILIPWQNIHDLGALTVVNLTPMSPLSETSSGFLFDIKTYSCLTPFFIWTSQVVVLKSRDITLPIKVHLVKAMVFAVVMYGCESWTVKKAER